MSATVSVVLVIESTAPASGHSDSFLTAFCEALDTSRTRSDLLIEWIRATEWLGPRHLDLATRLQPPYVGLIAGDEMAPLSYLAQLDGEQGAKVF